MVAIRWTLVSALLCLLASAATAGTPRLTAKLVDEKANSMHASAVVQVEVVGVELIDPALATANPKVIQAHLHYRVDDGPVIATPVTKLAFHELAAGSHRIDVVLADSNHQPLGPRQTLEVNIAAKLAGQE
jgi:hypothetical protein